MADKVVKISIKTTAETQGAKATTDAIRETTAATTQLDTATHNLGSKVTQASQKTETFTAGHTKLNTPIRSNSQALLMFSQGLEDAQYGIRGVLNNIPGLIVSLGGTAGLAGAISIAAVSISVLYEQFSKMGGKVQSATEKLEFMKAAVDEIAKNKGLELEDEFADSARAIESAALSAAALKQEFIETKKAVNELALAQLELSAENAKAARLDMEIKGRPANMKPADWENAMSPLRTVEADATAAAEKAREVARQALVTDQERLKTAQDMAAEAAKTLSAREVDKDKAKVILDVEREILTALRLQKAAKEKVVKEAFDEPTTVKGKSFTARLEKAKIAESAKTDLSGGSPFTAQLKIAEERIATLEKSLTDNASKLNTDITGAKTALDAANTKLTDTTSAVEVGAETINAELTRKTTVEIVSLKKAGLETGKTVTDAAKDAIKAVEDEAAKQGRDMNLPEQEAVGRIQKLIADTVPDSAQGGQLQSLIQGLANNITAKDSALAGGLDRLISLVGRQTTQYTVLLGKIADLEAKQKQVK